MNVLRLRAITYPPASRRAQRARIPRTYRRISRAAIVWRGQWYDPAVLAVPRAVGHTT